MIVACPGCRSRYDVTGRAPGTKARCRCGTTFPLPAPNTHAAALQCPNCGAAADPEKRDCTYCKTALAPVACASCFGMVFTGTRHCPHCGQRADSSAKAIDDAARARTCPRCKPRSSLVANLVGDVLLDGCSKCGGMFVDRATFDRLVTDRDRQAAVYKVLAGDGGLEIEGERTADVVTYLKCPECATLMMRQNFGRRSGVIIDVCKLHGTWFDAAELSRVISFVQKGGLDETRRREIEQLERELADKRTRAASHSYASTWEAEQAPPQDLGDFLSSLAGLLLGR